MVHDRGHGQRLTTDAAAAVADGGQLLPAVAAVPGSGPAVAAAASAVCDCCCRLRLAPVCGAAAVVEVDRLDATHCCSPRLPRRPQVSHPVTRKSVKSGTWVLIF